MNKICLISLFFLSEFSWVLLVWVSSPLIIQLCVRYLDIQLQLDAFSILLDLAQYLYDKVDIYSQRILV